MRRRMPVPVRIPTGRRVPGGSGHRLVRAAAWGPARIRVGRSGSAAGSRGLAGRCNPLTPARIRPPKPGELPARRGERRRNPVCRSTPRARSCRARNRTGRRHRNPVAAPDRRTASGAWAYSGSGRAGSVRTGAVHRPVRRARSVPTNRRTPRILPVVPGDPQAGSATVADRRFPVVRIPLRAGSRTRRRKCPREPANPAAEDAPPPPAWVHRRTPGVRARDRRVGRRIRQAAGRAGEAAKEAAATAVHRARRERRRVLGDSRAQAVPAV